MDQEYSSLMDFLNKTGVLQRGSTEEIAQAKKEYRRYYMRKYKREQRGNKQELVLSISKEFYKLLNKEAKRHGISIPRFVVEIIRGYLYSVPVIHHPDQFAKIEIKIAQLHSELQFIGDQMFLSPVQPDIENLKQQISKIELELESASRSKDLEEFLVEYSELNPENNQILIAMLERLAGSNKNRPD